MPSLANFISIKHKVVYIRIKTAIHTYNSSNNILESTFKKFLIDEYVYIN